ncbi:MAG: Flp pilus assembly complex ATPase component TadA [Planctomycetes bacterium]|nr:Flp pilus assembly complex ATPase component TadA [Planctomycetota bacterium]
MSRPLLGQILVAQDIVEEKQIDEALRLQKETGAKLGQALLKLGHIDDDQLGRALARQAQMPFVDLKKGRIAPEVIQLVPANLAEEYGIVPIKVQGKDVIVALVDPVQAFNLENLRFLLNLNFRCAVASESGLREAFKRYYEVEKTDLGQDPSARKKEEEDEDAPIIRLVDKIIEGAVRKRASDIHVEPYSDHLRVRYRVDGVCQTVDRHARHLQGPVISRLKIMAGMDISEKRKPQDGRIMTRVLSKDIDMRVSGLPGVNGESLVMRILDKEEGLVSLEKLGFVGDDLRRFERIIKRPNGIFLVTGPTGSGKTTTLYAALKSLNRPDIKIITAENPVEYNLKGVNQVQVKHSIGLDFARILRAMLRQAPNIILVGEIRDKETASIAIQAALTGHLVFSTLHTNDAPSAITRLIDMGVAPYMVSTSIVAVLAQRLVRTLCKHCRDPYEPTAAELLTIGLKPEQLQGRPVYRPKGCQKCGFGGYAGRIGVFEMMQMDETLREMTFEGVSHLDLRRQALLGGMSSLRADGARKVLEGMTSIEDVLRVVSQEATDPS